jgi:hypothetical protein
MNHNESHLIFKQLKYYTFFMVQELLKGKP